MPKKKFKIKRLIYWVKVNILKKTFISLVNGKTAQKVDPSYESKSIEKLHISDLNEITRYYSKLGYKIEIKKIKNN